MDAAFSAFVAVPWNILSISILASSASVFDVPEILSLNTARMPF
jgi:hypothetical protein